MRIVVVAGELSGDTLGGGLMHALRTRVPSVRFAGVGGPRMLAAGLEPWEPLESLSIMGLVEVLGHLPRLIALRARLRRQTLNWKPDLFIGIDAPDFNLGLERRLRDAGVPTVHYVSPTVWAWRRGRIHTVARAVDLMLTLLPFEAAYYSEHGVPVSFVGHPLADEIPLETDPVQARSTLGLPAGPLIALLPGSRRGEIERLAPVFLQTARWIHERRPEVRFVLPAASGELAELLTRMRDAHGPALPVTLVRGQARTAMTAANAVLVASGTATLEAMLLGRPMVMAYRVAPLTAWLARRLVHVRRFALPNLLAGRDVVPEFLQHEARADLLGPAMLSALDRFDPEVLAQFRAMHRELRRNADSTAAEAVLRLVTRAAVAAGVN